MFKYIEKYMDSLPAHIRTRILYCYGMSFVIIAALFFIKVFIDIYNGVIW